MRKLLKRIASILWRPQQRKICSERKPLKYGRLRPTVQPWYLFILIVPVVFFFQSLGVKKVGSATQLNVVIDTVDDTRSVVKDTKSINENSTKGFGRLISCTKTEKAITATTSGPPVKPSCPGKQDNYGKTYLTITNITMNFLSTGLKPVFALVKDGEHIPTECAARHKVAILVPYRDREMNLAVFLYNMHPFLIKQKIEYRIFVLEQYGKELFNKGRLYNAGFKEMQKYGQFSCIVLHDVDLLPTHEQILYGCPVYPRHMCATVLEKKNDTSFRTIFGGVVAMSCEHYQRANGFSNMYWGWGGEDNDIFWRIRAARLPVVRYDKKIAVYISLPHPSRPVNPYRYTLINSARERYQEEGLSTVAYRLISKKNHHLYTHMLFDINPYKENVTSLMQYYVKNHFSQNQRKRNQKSVKPSNYTYL